MKEKYAMLLAMLIVYGLAGLISLAGVVFIIWLACRIIKAVFMG